MVVPTYYNNITTGTKLRLKPGMYQHYRTIAPWSVLGENAIVTVTTFEGGYRVNFQEVKGWSDIADFERCLPHLQIKMSKSESVEQDPDNISVDLYEDVPSPVEQLKVIFKSHNIQYDGNNLVEAVTQLSARNKQNLAAFKELTKVCNQFSSALDSAFYPEE